MEVQSTKSESFDISEAQTIQTIISNITQINKLMDDIRSDTRDTVTKRTKKELRAEETRI